MGYWEEDSDVRYECRDCERYEDKIEELNEEFAKAGEMFSSIIKMLYSKEKINMSQLEKEIDDLCYHFDVEMVKGDIQIKQKGLPSFLNNLLELNYA